MRSLRLFFLVLSVFMAVSVDIVHGEEEHEEEKEKKLPPNFDDFSFGGPGSHKTCLNYRCARGMDPVLKTRAKFTSPGCGAMNSGMVLFAGKPEDEVYESCCDQWFGCYQTCGSTKKKCDEHFKTCGENMCMNDEACMKKLSMSNLMIQMSGCQRFNDMQNEACDCVDKSISNERHETSIRRFYRTHAPGNGAKAKELALKADTPHKFAALWRKLLLKYPQAIEKVLDPKSEEYRKLFKEAEKGDGKWDKEDTTSGYVEYREQDSNEDIQEL